MKCKFKKGDKVIATEDRVDGGYFTKGKIYTVVDIDDDTVCIVDDDGDEEWWMDHEFEHTVTSDEGILSLTEAMVGQVVTFNRKKYAIDNWSRLTAANLTKDTPKNISDIIAKYGFCFCVSSGEFIMPASKVKKVDNRIVLNSEYTALISKDVINVGCQAISYNKVLEIVNTHKALYGN